MARGNWNPSVIKPQPRCLLCNRVVKGVDFVRLNGINPAHRSCALAKNRAFTEGQEIHKGGIQKSDADPSESMA